MPNKKPALVSMHGKTVDLIAKELYKVMSQQRQPNTKKSKTT